MNKKLPFFLRSCLWSYNLKKLDLEKDKALIIEHILNYGGDEPVKWLLKTYTKRDIISVLKNPSRGFWYEESLNFWLLVSNIKLDKETYEKAIKKIYPEAKTF